jgi:hypothetical protein
VVAVRSKLLLLQAQVQLYTHARVHAKRTCNSTWWVPETAIHAVSL